MDKKNKELFVCACVFQWLIVMCLHVKTHPGGTRWNPTQEQIGILEMLYRGGMRTPNAQQIEQITTQLGKYGKIEGKNVFYWFQNHKARERQKQKRSNLGLSHSPRSSSASFSTITLWTRVGSFYSLLLTYCIYNLSTSQKTYFLVFALQLGYFVKLSLYILCNLHMLKNILYHFNLQGDKQAEESSPILKRKCRAWSFEKLEEDKSYSISSREDEEGDKISKTLELFPLHPEGRRK